jgi:hypothetical protein
MRLRCADLHRPDFAPGVLFLAHVPHTPGHDRVAVVREIAADERLEELRGFAERATEALRDLVTSSSPKWRCSLLTTPAAPAWSMPMPRILYGRRGRADHEFHDRVVVDEAARGRDEFGRRPQSGYGIPSSCARRCERLLRHPEERQHVDRADQSSAVLERDAMPGFPGPAAWRPPGPRRSRRPSALPVRARVERPREDADDRREIDLVARSMPMKHSRPTQRRLEHGRRRWSCTWPTPRS